MRNNLCDFNDAYIVVTGKMTATNPGNDDNVYNRKVSLKNSVPFFNCTLKINSQLTEDVQDLDIAIPMYNLLYYSKSFRKTTGSFWDYYPDIPKSAHDNNANLRQRMIYSIKDSEGFDYKTKLIGNVPGVADPADNDVQTELEDIKIVEPLKNISNFMFNLQTEYQNQLYKDLKTGILIDFKWNKCRSQMINQTATNNLNFLIDPTFNNVNILFVLAFPNEQDRRSFSKYYTPTVEIKDYNVIIDGEPFYEIQIKNKEDKELIRNDLLRTGNEFNFDYFYEHYKLIAIDLGKQKSDLKNQQINFIGRLE